MQRPRIDLDGVTLMDVNNPYMPLAVFRFRTTEGLVLLVPESADVLIGWEHVEEAALDFIHGDLRIRFRPEYVASQNWLRGAAEISARRRLQQLDTILHDAARFPVAVVGGDMNTADIGPTVRAHGFLWPTIGLPKTTRFGRWDHVLVRGGALAMPARAGTVEAGRSASDHDAVWVRIPIRARPPLQPSQDCARRVPGTLAPPATSGAPT